jgi:hypothetical protein
MPLNLYQDSPTLKATYTTLGLLLAAVGSGKTVIVKKPVSVDADIDLNALGISCQFVDTGMLVIQPGVSLTMGQIENVHGGQIFSCAPADAPALSGCKSVIPEWFGPCDGLGVDDDTAAIQSAFNAVPTLGEVRFQAKMYRAVYLTLSDKPITLRGAGMYCTNIRLHADTAPVLIVSHSTATIGFNMFDISFYYAPFDPNSTQVGVYLRNVQLAKIDGCTFAGFDIGLQMYHGCSTTQVTNCVFGSANRIGCYVNPQADCAIGFVNNWFDENDEIGLSLYGSRINVVGNRFQDNVGKQILITGPAGATQIDIVGNTFFSGGAPRDTEVAIDSYGEDVNILGNSFDQHSSSNDIIIRSTALRNCIQNNTSPHVLRISDSVTKTAVITDDGGTYTAGNIGVDVNGKTYTQTYDTDKDTTLTALAVALQASNAISTAVYDSVAHTITLTPATYYTLSVSTTLTSITGTMTMAVSYTGTQIMYPQAGGKQVVSGEMRCNTLLAVSAQQATNNEDAASGGFGAIYAYGGIRALLNIVSKQTVYGADVLKTNTASPVYWDSEGISLNRASGTGYIIWKDGSAVSKWTAIRSDASNFRIHANNTASQKVVISKAQATTEFEFDLDNKTVSVNGSAVIGERKAALTAQLTTITHTAPGTPDYALQDLTDSGGFGFATKDEGNSVLAVIANLQTRIAELEARLSAAAGHGLIADP